MPDIRENNGSRLGGVPYVFDVVLSDFGRPAALKLLDQVCRVERDLLASILRDEYATNLEFLDEYRRIMFSCVGDVAYVKRDILASRAFKGDLLPRSVLFGVEGRGISEEEVRSLARLLAGPALEAQDRGYKIIRLILPCNTLGSVEERLQQALVEALGQPVKLVGLEGVSLGPEAGVFLYSVPRVVLSHLFRTVGDASILVVGTTLSQRTYRSVLTQMGGRGSSVVVLNSEEQRLVDDLVLASIGGNAGQIAEATDRFESVVLSPHQAASGGAGLHAIQASTDLDLAIGSSSLRILAQELVLDVYGAAIRALPPTLRGPRQGAVE